MTRTKSIIGALVLCALAISAFGAASASAEGLTAVECVKVAPNHQFSTSKCATSEGEGEFETVAIKAGVKKEVGGTDTRNLPEGGHGLGKTGTIGVGNFGEPVTVFHGVVGGIATTVTCGKGVTAGGKIENTENSGTGEMHIHTTEAVVTWTECHASPETKPEKACKVVGTAPATAEGELKTNPLTAITGANHTVTITPEGGQPFIEFKILKSSTENCFTGSDLPVKVTGNAMGTANTETHSHLTINEPWPCGGAEQPACGELKANNAKAAQTQTVTGFTKGTETTVGATTESKIKETEA